MMFIVKYQTKTAGVTFADSHSEHETKEFKSVEEIKNWILKNTHVDRKTKDAKCWFPFVEPATLKFVATKDKQFFVHAIMHDDKYCYSDGFYTNQNKFLGKTVAELMRECAKEIAAKRMRTE